MHFKRRKLQKTDIKKIGGICSYFKNKDEDRKEKEIKYFEKILKLKLKEVKFIEDRLGVLKK